LLHQALASQLGEPVEQRIPNLSLPDKATPKTAEGHIVSKSIQSTLADHL
jgi:hypothetical protein